MNINPILLFTLLAAFSIYLFFRVGLYLAHRLVAHMPSTQRTLLSRTGTAIFIAQALLVALVVFWGSVHTELPIGRFLVSSLGAFTAFVATGLLAGVVSAILQSRGIAIFHTRRSRG